MVALLPLLGGVLLGWIGPALAVVSAGTLLLGFWIARRNGTRTDNSAAR